MLWPCDNDGGIAIATGMCYHDRVEKEEQDMPKISLSIPLEVLEFVDKQGKNRSKAIVTILDDYRRKRQEEELSRAYEEYADFCKEDDKNWWKQYESASLDDIGRSYKKK